MEVWKRLNERIGKREEVEKTEKLKSTEQWREKKGLLKDERKLKIRESSTEEGRKG